MLKIAVVSPYFPTKDRPAYGRSAYETVRCLARKTALRAYCPLAAYPRWRLLHPRTYPYREAAIDYSPPGVETEYFRYPVVPVLSRPFNGAICASRLLPRLKEARPDVILNYWLYPEGYASVRAGQRLGIPVVVGALGSDVRCITDRITRHLTRKAVRQADAVITVSAELRRSVISLGASPDRVFAVLNGCDREVFRPSSRAAARGMLGLDETWRIVLFVGNLHPVKGLHDLIEAFSKVAAATPSAHLILVGEGSLRGELQEVARRGGLGQRVHFPGRCSFDEVARWMAASDLFCLPSHSEGCPNVVIEALSCGLPVVATEVGGTPELVNESCGILVSPQSPGALGEAISRALNTEWDTHTISTAMSRSWETVAQETLDICRRVSRREA